MNLFSLAWSSLSAASPKDWINDTKNTKNIDQIGRFINPVGQPAQSDAAYPGSVVSVAKKTLGL